jgi:predicted nucleotidyltransferase component of viral defense system
MDKQDFNELVSLAMQQPGRSAMKPVVEKEILHYDIFYALDNAGLLKDLVFQGGTSLRLCRGSSRFSEDLDFAGGKDFNASKMTAIKACIETHIGGKYGLLVEVKEPKEMALSADFNGVRVDKWQVSVETAPQQRDLPRQRIKLEIANIPAYTRELVPLRFNYAFLVGFGTVLVNAESLDEVMADKIVAFPAAKNIRYRDIWDLAWLHQQGAKLDTSLVVKKISDYRIENYRNLLGSTIKTLPDIIVSKPFYDQMLRFIDSETISKTLANPQFLTYLEKTVNGLFAAMAVYLNDEPVNKAAEPSFKM